MDREKAFAEILEGLITTTSEFAEAIGKYAEILELSSTVLDNLAHQACEET